MVYYQVFVKFTWVLKPSTKQFCSPQAGVGTWFQPGVVAPIFEWGAKVLDLAFAWWAFLTFDSDMVY